MTKNIFDLAGKTVVLTGGLGLIGKNFVGALTEAGANVHIIDVVKNDAAAKMLRDSFPDFSERIVYHEANITDRDALIKVREDILKARGAVDVLINNAALNPKVEAGSMASAAKSSFEEMKLDDWNRELAVNLTGTMLCCQVFGAVMKRGGSIINVGSTYGIVAPDQRLYSGGFVKPATYGVSKAGVIALTKYLAAYWGAKGVRVNCIAPGGVENNQDPEFVKRYSERTPLGAMAAPGDYNGIIIYLASSASAYATGGVFSVDGGWTAW